MRTDIRTGDGSLEAPASTAAGAPPAPQAGPHGSSIGCGNGAPAPSAGPAFKATHWSVEDDPEAWFDNPAEHPEIAVEEWLANRSESASEIAYDIVSGGTETIEVHGYIETSAPLDPEVAFDGYEPGCTYFAPTRERRKVRVSLLIEVQP